MIKSLEIMKPFSVLYNIDGSIIFAPPQAKRKHCKRYIDQKCKERILVSKGIHYPLLYINWLITPKCNYSCLYCYAKDIMQSTQEPTLNKILDTAHSILQFDPVVVVLSGGEPFLSPYLEDIITYLSGKTRIIIDTNGSVVNQDLLQTLKEKEVLLRISLDDVNAERNSLVRCNSFDGTNQTKKLILQCIQAGIDLVVQTVVTRANYPYLNDLKEYLEMIGVKYWRLLPVSNSTPKEIPLKCTSEEIHRLRDTFCQHSDVGMEITIQHEYENERGGIVLVSPDGTFLTIDDDGKKVCIDPLHPHNPSNEILDQVIDWKAHYLRYIVAQKEEK